MCCFCRPITGMLGWAPKLLGWKSLQEPSQSTKEWALAWLAHWLALLRYLEHQFQRVILATQQTGEGETPSLLSLHKFTLHGLCEYTDVKSISGHASPRCNAIRRLFTSTRCRYAGRPT